MRVRRDDPDLRRLSTPSSPSCTRPAYDPIWCGSRTSFQIPTAATANRFRSWCRRQPNCVKKDQRLVLCLSRGRDLLLGGTAAVTSAAVSPLAVAAAVGAGFDPIVLGRVRHPDAPVVRWVLLAQWEWE